jgi:hypothetical protein
VYDVSAIGKVDVHSVASFGSDGRRLSVSTFRIVCRASAFCFQPSSSHLPTSAFFCRASGYCVDQRIVLRKLLHLVSPLSNQSLHSNAVRYWLSCSLTVSTLQSFIQIPQGQSFIVVARAPTDSSDRTYIKMVQPFRMLDLPTELIRRICTNKGFDRRDLMALRSTCTLTCGFSTHPFDDMCFSEISILLTRRSLRALVDVSSHPRIAPLVKVINLTPLRTTAEAFQYFVPGPRPIYHEGDLAEDKSSGKAVYQCLDRYHEEMEFEQSSDAVGLLTKAFISLGKFDHSLCLAISDVEWTKTYIGAQGCISGGRVSVIGQPSLFRLHWGEVVGFLIKAVVDSGCQVSRLSLVNDTGAILVGDRKLWNDNLNKDIERLSANLTAFEVDILDHKPEDSLKSVKQVLVRASDLDVFMFQRGGKILYDDLVEISDSIASSSLTTIDMSNLHCSVWDLISLLDKHNSSLKGFLLSATQLVGSWKSLVRWIRSNLTLLCTFVMEGTYDDGYRSDGHYEAVPDCDFDEIKGMSAALEGLLTKSGRRTANGIDFTLSTG